MSRQLQEARPFGASDANTYGNGERKSKFSELQDMHDVDRRPSFRVDKFLCRVAGGLGLEA